jgi:hypothetical protein
MRTQLPFAASAQSSPHLRRFCQNGLTPTIRCRRIPLKPRHLGARARISNYHSKFWTDFVFELHTYQSVRGTFLGGKVALNLVRAVLDWEKSQDAHLVLFYVSSGEHIAKTDRFFRKLGAVRLRGNYGVRL